MKHAFILLTVCAFLHSTSAGAPDERWRTSIPSLAGLNGVYVTVQFDAPIEPQYGVSEVALRSALELRLKANDIHILNEEEWSSSARKPYLCLTVKGSKLGSNTKDPEFLFAWGLDLIQTVRILDEPKLESKASTWTQQYSAVLPEHALRNIAVRVSALALEFANAMKTAKEGEAR